MMLTRFARRLPGVVGGSLLTWPWAARSVTARFGATPNPLADARGSDRSPDGVPSGPGGVAPYSTTSHGHITSRRAQDESVANYSSRRAAMGSTRVARHAGRKHATR